MNKIAFRTLLTLALAFTSLNSFAGDHNKLLDLSEYRGKVVYLDFWASWCVPCRKSFPWMNEQQSKYSKQDFVIIAVNLDKKKSLANTFLTDNPANFQVIYDPKGELAKHYQIKGMPSSILFDRNGKPVKAHTGFFVKKKAEYEQEIELLVQTKAD